MSRVVVIGATGHIGSYLVPRLVRGGHEVFEMSRGSREPYHPSPQWDSVTTVTADRDALDAEGAFGAIRPPVNGSSTRQDASSGAPRAAATLGPCRREVGRHDRQVP
jgi:NAD(P)-dependent dehydrogenase (short-subunit alcohol dehydrogenase family)